ncbi:hypothetical protein BOX15_Mlig032474g3 [Macrostomum lignano]|uniref:BK channel n=1 Tax=Macrostomum lignano TaxID=282301 RepID=A0A267FZ30_9PLAT|nr:hypothetical protein BOX15_Mlig032474g3 [Macrostomum lignano]
MATTPASTAGSTTSGVVAACSTRLWYIHLASTAIAFIGGLLLVLLVRLVGWLVKRIRRSSQGGSTEIGKDAAMVAKGNGQTIEGDRIDWTAEVKEWANELISAQSITGRILVVLIFSLSVSSLGIYIYEATFLVGFVENCVPWSQSVLNQVDLAFNIVFLIYFCIRFLAAQDKLWFWLEIYSIVDYCTVPPAFVNIYLNQSWLGLRFIRCLRIMTLPDVLQYLSVLKSGTVIRFFQMVTTFLSVWVIGAGITHLCENSGDPQYEYSNVNGITFGNCMYFTIVTMSTVGFGDYSPKTDWGKFFISFYIMVALGIFASFIPEIAEIITSRSPYAGRYKKEHGRRHVVVCGAVTKESIESFLEDFLHEDREDTDVEVVCINKKAPSLEFQSLLKRNFGHLVYFIGSVLNPTDCQRVCLESSAAAIILCNKYDEDPDAEDASNIMRVISIKNVSPKTRCIIQLLQYHNKGYLLNIPNWDWRLGDECLCVAEMKQGFLAQSCLAPGFSTLMANLFSTRAMSDSHLIGSWEKDYQDGSAMEIYSEYFSDSFVGMTFQEAVMLCYNKLRVILFAIEAKNSEGDRFLSINPPGRSAIIYNGCHGFFVADSQEEVRRAYLYCNRCHRDLADPRQIRKCSCQTEVSGPESPGHDGAHEVTRLRGNSANVRRPEIQVASRKKVLAAVQETEFGADEQQRYGEYSGDDPSKQSTEYFDLTGMFHWCPERNFEDVMLKPGSAARLNLREHYIVIVFADSDSHLIGLRSFVMPLRPATFI